MASKIRHQAVWFTPAEIELLQKLTKKPLKVFVKQAFYDNLDKISPDLGQKKQNSGKNE